MSTYYRDGTLAQSGTIYSNCTIHLDRPHKSGSTIKSRAYGSCAPTGSNRTVELYIGAIDWEMSNHLFYKVPCPRLEDYDGMVISGIAAWIVQQICNLSPRRVSSAGPETGHPSHAPRWARNRLIVTGSCTGFFDSGDYAALTIVSGRSSTLPEVRADTSFGHTGYHLIRCP